MFTSVERLLADTSHADIDTWLTGEPGRYQIRDFLLWAATAEHAHQLTVATRGRATGPPPATNTASP